MKKLICLFLLVITLASIVACDSRIDAEKQNTPEPFELVIYEEDTNGYVMHKVLYNTETKLYHEYIYFYLYDGTYRNIDRINYIIYDQYGNVIKSEVQNESTEGLD